MGRAVWILYGASHLALLFAVPPGARMAVIQEETRGPSYNLIGTRRYFLDTWAHLDVCSFAWGYCCFG